MSDVNSPRKHTAEWPAVFLVAAELERRGYVASIILNPNNPWADLMVGHPNTGEQFWVDVKGLRKSNAWTGKAKGERANLFYILVLVGKTRTGDRFFVLSQADFNGLVEQYQRDHPTAKPIGGFDWTDPHEFEDKWDKLPSWNVPSN